MFSPASASSAILARKNGFSKYTRALVMNIRAPVTAVRAKAAQVSFSMSCDTRLKARSLDATLRMRRSTIMIVPNTRVRPITCTASSVGKISSELRMAAARPEFCSACRAGTGSIP